MWVDFCGHLRDSRSNNLLKLLKCVGNLASKKVSMSVSNPDPLWSLVKQMFLGPSDKETVMGGGPKNMHFKITSQFSRTLKPENYWSAFSSILTGQKKVKET